MELRPCFEGFAGIPQETRLVFSMLNRIDNVEVTGLINHAARYLKTARLSKNWIFKDPLDDFHRLHKNSRLALSTKADPLETAWDRFLRNFGKGLSSRWLEMSALFGISIKVRPFDGRNFGDFLWQTLFSKTLPAADFKVIRMANMAAIRAPWNELHPIAAKALRGVDWPPPKMDTRHYDAFISQTPWPTVVSARTQLIVRYHDAIPVFLPHTIPHAAEHQMSHMAGLRLSQRRGIFACTSEATRSDLLKLVPHVEKRSVVIPNVVSREYFLEVGNPKYISSIIRNNIDPETEPKFLTHREKDRFYSTHLDTKPVRFLIMVSTLEPRKNHNKLIAAWDYLVHHGSSDLKLIIVGTLGWDNSTTTRAMAPHQTQGRIFHLQGVPSGHLRVLYNAAEAVVCPSFCEGFDLSGIEAMLCGGAVVASDIAVHREVYANACEYFNPYSMLDQAKALQNVIMPESRPRREELVEAGLRHASKYRGENIQPVWHEFFERIRMGDFKHGGRLTLQGGLPKSSSRDPGFSPEGIMSGNGQLADKDSAQRELPSRSATNIQLAESERTK